MTLIQWLAGILSSLLEQQVMHFWFPIPCTFVERCQPKCQELYCMSAEISYKLIDLNWHQDTFYIEMKNDHLPHRPICPSSFLMCPCILFSFAGFLERISEKNKEYLKSNSHMWRKKYNCIDSFRLMMLPYFWFSA